MCFKVVFDKTIIGKVPAFWKLENEPYPQGNISAFNFPLLPVLISESPREAITAQWGLIPAWVKEFEKAKKIRSATVNARSETLHEKPSFRNSWPVKRCILPVTGFFEPHEISRGGKKESWQIERRDKTLFYLGGIYAETSKNLLIKEPREIDLFGERPAQQSFFDKTFSLLTLEASGLLARIHNGKLRMPFMMSEEKALEWISQNPGDTSILLESFWQLDQEELTGFKVNSTDSLSAG